MVKLSVTSLGAEFHSFMASLTQELCVKVDLPIAIGLPRAAALVVETYSHWVKHQL